MADREHMDEPQPEIVINRSSSRDGQVGWRIGLLRREGEGDEQYTNRVVEKHRELEKRLLLRTCCHDQDECETRVAEAARTTMGA